MKVSDAVARFLELKKVRHSFGIIGSGNAHIFDSVTSHGATQIVCVHHEQAATMAMQTYYRTSGQAAVCLVTTGAGSSNAITGVISAWMDSMPGLVISGNENSKFTIADNPLRVWGIQGYDSSEMVKGVTKYSARVSDPLKIWEELDRAWTFATTGRPGPVWLDIPMNIQAMVISDEVPAEILNPKLNPAKPLFNPIAADQKLTEIVDALEKAERPILWLGHGIRMGGGTDLVVPLIEKTGIPTLLTWNGIDLAPSEHPLVFGRAGVYGQRHSNFVLQNSDFILAIGTRLAMPQIGYAVEELARAAQIAVVDIDPSELEKLGDRIKYRVHADATFFIQKMIEALSKKSLPSRKPWVAQCQDYRERYPRIGPEHADPPGFINSYRFMAEMEPYFKRDQLIVTDMGTALLSGHQVIHLKPGQRMMTSTGLGEMGYGLPAAIGASFARDRGEVLCLNCDGGMMMNLQELQTIKHHRLPIKIIVFNNDGYLMIKHTQKALFAGRYAGTDERSGVSCPDFSKVATAFDMPSFVIRTWEDFHEIFPRFQRLDEPAICEVMMHPEQLFLPKLSLAPQAGGVIVSPPLEDLAPFLPREELRKNMVIGMHPKSEQVGVGTGGPAGGHRPA